MKILKNYLWVGLNVVVAFTACQKSELNEVRINNSTPDVRVKDGMLVFKDSTVFMQYFNKLTKNQELGLPNTNFTSYQEVYEDIQEKYASLSDESQIEDFLKKFGSKIKFNSDSSISPFFVNPLVHTLINIEGKFMIGNKLQLFTADKYIEIQNPDNSKIQQALSNRYDGNKIGDIKVYSYGAQDDSSLPTVKSVIPDGRINETIHYNNAHDRRLFIQTFNDPIPGGWGSNHLYLRLYQEKKGTFGGWNGNSTDIYMSNLLYNLTVTMPAPISPSLAAYSYPGSALAYQNGTWLNASVVYYNLSFYLGSGYVNYVDYNFLEAVNFSGHFFSGGVPNAPTTTYIIY